MLFSAPDMTKRSTEFICCIVSNIMNILRNLTEKQIGHALFKTQIDYL